MPRRKAKRRSPSQPKNPWSIKPEWKDQDVFILCGGTSVTPEALSMLKGRNVIALNSVYTIAPWVPILFFADARWWRREIAERQKLLDAFKGRIFTTSRLAHDGRLHQLKHLRPESGAGLAKAPDTVSIARTALNAAINMAVHLGASRIILVGADNRDGENGRVHCHEEYPWRRPSGTWQSKLNELAHCVPELAAMKIPVLNCSPISALPWWPKVKLETVLTGVF